MSHILIYFIIYYNEIQVLSLNLELWLAYKVCFLNFSVVKRRCNKVKCRGSLWHLAFKKLRLKFNKKFIKNLFLLDTHLFLIYGHFLVSVQHTQICI